MKLRPSYEVWTFLTRNGQAITEKTRACSPLGNRFWTQGGAKRWGKRLTNNPTVLAATLRSALRPNMDGYLTFADFEIRDARGVVVYHTQEPR